MSVSRYVRKGQRTYHGMTAEEVREQAAFHRNLAFVHYYGNPGDREIAAENRERAAWYDKVAARMEEPRVHHK